jgi:hypothetical protein
MDRLDKTAVNANEGFIKTVFPFDDNQKALLLNIVQYTVLAIIPIVALLKLIKVYVPEVDENKSSLLLLAEVIGQSGVMFVSLYFIHSMIAYIPTYSEKGYGDVNIINIIPSILLISITMQSKLGEKVQILVDRLWDLYEGHSSLSNVAAQVHRSSASQALAPVQGQVRVTQPLSNQYVSNNNIDLPPALQPQMTKSQQSEPSVKQVVYQQPSPDFNNMYASPETHMVGAAMSSMEPMAANDFLGGSTFGSSF